MKLKKLILDETEKYQSRRIERRCPRCHKNNYQYVQGGVKPNIRKAIVKCTNCGHLFSAVLRKDEMWDDQDK